MADEQTLLRLVACGSVDDGKSTLIGRLLYDLGAVPDDQLAALASDSKSAGTRGGELDFALLVDGLMAEREQGITIDVAYRYFATTKRKFIVADSPGHAQYTRNMVTAASNADLAIVLVDARKGVLTQTRRHAFICALMGIRQVVLAVTKMDLVGYAQETFDRIVADFAALAKKFEIERFAAIPVSGVSGDNIAAKGASTPWYDGRPLIELLENAETREVWRAEQPMRMAVQAVVRPHQDFRGFAGRLSAGSISPGEAVRILFVPAPAACTVLCWSTLHQPASVFRMDGPSIHPSMLWPLLLMALGFNAYYLVVMILRVKSELIAARLNARAALAASQAA